MPVTAIALNNKSNGLDDKITNKCAHGLFGNVFYADVIQHCFDFALYACLFPSDCVRSICSVAIKAAKLTATGCEAFLRGVLFSAPLTCKLDSSVKRMAFTCYRALAFVLAFPRTKSPAATLDPRWDDFKLASALFADSLNAVSWSSRYILHFSSGSMKALHSAVVFIWGYSGRRAMKSLSAITTNKRCWHEKTSCRLA